MDRDSFRKLIKEELAKVDRKKSVLFAWRCAVRSIPYLGRMGHFDYWKKKDRQRHIYALFYALDVSAADISDTLAAADAYDAYVAVASAADAASPADAADAVSAAAYAASADAYHAYASSAADAAARNALQEIIHKDLMSLNGRGEPFSTAFYGEIWDNFQKALIAEGCEYWAKVYQNIFDNGFSLDREALRRRLNVPKEIRSRGAAEVAIFLEEFSSKGATRLNEARIIILGDKGAGKTCLARKLVNPDAPMTTDEESTPGVDTLFWELKEEKIKVHIWDFAGHTVTHAVHQFFLSERCLYIMVYDGRTERRNQLEYWLDHMKNYGGDSKAIILVNKRDNHTVSIPINSLKERYPITSVHYFDLKTDKEDLLACRREVADFIKNNPSWQTQEIPKSYYQVKEELERLFVKGDMATGEEHITRERFYQIARKHEVENADELLINLHSLGVILHYEKMQEFNTLVLNPEWISYGVYKIINWVHDKNKHSIALSDFEDIFNQEAKRYPKDKHEFLFRLMMHFELAYETKRGRELIIPHLLKEDQPEELPIFYEEESLMLRFKAEQPLPPDTISRFIVRHNEKIKLDKRNKDNENYMVWRYGVGLEDNQGNFALVRELDRTILVSVRGENKTDFLSTLRETLNDIFNSYKSNMPELQYRLDQLASKPGQQPLWVSEETIMNHIKANKSVIWDSYSNQNIPIQMIIQTLNLPTIHNHVETMNEGRGTDKSAYNTFNFKDVNISLQGNFNELADYLIEEGNIEEAKELRIAAGLLEKVEECKTPEEVRKKGVANRLRRIIEELGDKNAKLHKTVERIMYGISMAQDIVETYNEISQWIGLPQVPNPFLKKKGKGVG